MLSKPIPRDTAAFAYNEADQQDGGHAGACSEPEQIAGCNRVVEGSVAVAGVGQGEKQHVKGVSADDAADGELQRAATNRDEGGHQLRQRGRYGGHERPDGGGGYAERVDDSRAGYGNHIPGQRKDSGQHEEGTRPGGARMTVPRRSRPGDPFACRRSLRGATWDVFSRAPRCAR